MQPKEEGNVSLILGIDEWHKFDDDKVSVVKDADIERLDGGGKGELWKQGVYRRELTIIMG